MNHKKHNTRWFTTSEYRAINLDLVTDVTFTRHQGTVTGALVSVAATSGDGQASIHISTADAVRLFEQLY